VSLLGEEKRRGEAVSTGDMEVWKICRRRMFGGVDLRQASLFLQSKVRNIFQRRSPLPAEPEAFVKLRKPYEKPTVRKLTPEQATLVLTGHAMMGDQGARHLMDLVYPDPQQSAAEVASADPGTT
jgi:hypothetical protein